jgi:hypothetical protein
LARLRNAHDGAGADPLDGCAACAKNVEAWKAGDFLTLIDEDGGGEMRSARYRRFTIGDRLCKFLCFADPDHPDDCRR